MISSGPGMRRCMSWERIDGTIQSLSPLAIRVGWVSFDRSAGAELPSFDCHQLGPERLNLHRVAVDSVLRRRSTNAFAAGLPVALRLKNRKFFGFVRVSVPQDVGVGGAGDLVHVLAA